MKNIWLYCVVRFRCFVEGCRTAWKYYPKFLKIDLLLKKNYLFKNPFRISREFLQERGVDNVYAYGETPLTTMAKITRECNITQNDTVFELGCGAGRSSFWLSKFIGCNVTGIDYIPDFIDKANDIKDKLSLDNISFVNEDICLANYNTATIIYFYGTGFDDNTIQKLISHMDSLKENTKVITVSYPLTDYTSSFHLIKTFPATYTWGTANIYLHKKTTQK